MIKCASRYRRILVLMAITVTVLAASAVAALASGGKQIKVEDFVFSSGHVTIQRGGRVTWNWASTLNHNIVVRSGPVRFRSRTQPSGSFSHVFAKRGVYKLYCTLHAQTMKMTVVVK